MRKLSLEKNIENPKLNLAPINFTKNGEISESPYYITQKSENSGSTFSFYYTLARELIKMDY